MKRRAYFTTALCPLLDVRLNYLLHFVTCLIKKEDSCLSVRSKEITLTMTLNQSRLIQMKKVKVKTIHIKHLSQEINSESC